MITNCSRVTTHYDLQLRHVITIIYLFIMITIPDSAETTLDLEFRLILKSDSTIDVSVTVI